MANYQDGASFYDGGARQQQQQQQPPPMPRSALKNGTGKTRQKDPYLPNIQTSQFDRRQDQHPQQGYNGSQQQQQEQPYSGSQGYGSSQPYSGSQQPYSSAQPYSGSQPFSGSQQQQPYSSSPQPYGGPQAYGGLGGSNANGAGGGRAKSGIDNLLNDLMGELDDVPDPAMEHERGAGHTAPSPAPAPAPARAPASQLEAPPRRRPPCAGCGQEIARSRDAYRIEALGKVYHIRCFRCTVCEGDFDESRPFVPHDGQAYCEEDYQRVLETRCAGCNKSISGKPVYALGKPWHQEHLKCCACRKPVRGKVFESEGRIYCEEDYQALVAETCRGCGTPVQGETINALNSTYHKECFVCTTCRQPFQGRRFYVFDNDPVCLLHYHERNNSLCGGCQTGIEGPCADIPELGKRFHQECWCCALCQASLMDSYYSFEGRAYCEKDIAKVYRAETPGQRANKRQTLLLNL